MRTMEVRKTQVFVWVFVVEVIYLVNLAFCGNLKVSNTEGLDYCIELVKKAAKADVLPKLGVDIMGVHLTSKAFVYSELNIVNHLLQLFKVGSDSVRSEIKRYLQLPDNSICEELYCKHFQTLMDVITSTMGDKYYYGSVLFKDKSKSGPSWECGTEKTLDFQKSKESIVTEINNEYQNIVKLKQAQCLLDSLYKDTDFFMMNPFWVNLALFGVMGSHISSQKFLDLDGEERKVEWVEMEGFFRVKKMSLPQIVSQNSQNCDLILYSKQINGYSQYMLYFQVTFRLIKNVNFKIECIMEVFNNIRKYAALAIDTRVGGDRLIVPAMSIQTDINLRSLMEEDLPSLFKYKEIINLYTDPDTLYQMRSCDFFYNKDKDFSVSQVSSPLKEVYINGPFVFALFDRGTRIFLKTGAYLRP